MANERLGIRTNPMQYADIQGKSTDTKPLHTDAGEIGIIAGSTFYELDTTDMYVYSPTNINPATGNGWWVV